MSLIHIRQSDDWDTIYEMDREIFRDDLCLTEDDMRLATWWIAYAQDRTPLAYAGMRLGTPNKGSFIPRVGTLPIARGLGLQKRFTRAQVKHSRSFGAPRVHTYVAANNIASMRAYISCGFKPYKVEYDVANTWMWLETQKA